MKHDVPFVGNTDTDLQCLQATYMMVLKFFKPDFEIDWDKWVKVTGYEEGKGTWQTAGLLWFYEHGFEVKHIGMFDWNSFVRKGGGYLIELTGPEIGKWQIEHSNILLEIERAKEFMKLKLYERREPTKNDIIKYLEDGYLIVVVINMNKLNGKSGYVGHSVLVSGYDSEGLMIQDPGAPPVPNRKVSFKDFENAWADAGKESKELDALKLL